MGQAVPIDGADQMVLVLVGQSAEAVGQGGADLGPGEFPPGGLAEVSCDVEASANPVGTFAE